MTATPTLRPAAHAALVTALLAGAATAHAGGSYFVSTTANTGRGYDRGCTAEYNVYSGGGGAGGHFVVNDGSGAPCPTSPATFNGQVVTVSGSTDTTGKLPKAHDESTVTALPDAAYATAVADLKTGKIHLTAGAVGFSGANAAAELNDTLHFTVAGATAQTVTYIPVSFHFDGKMPGTSNPMTAQADLFYGFNFGNADAYEFGDYGAGIYGNFGRDPTFVFPATAGITHNWVSEAFTSYSPLDTTFKGIYAITGATADIPIDFRLAIDADNVALDFSHTASVSIGKIAGVSFTSDSGVFLTGGTGAVPEPDSWALLLAGFGSVGLAARRRRITTVAA